MSTFIYKNILENMDEGVLSVDLKGTITTFNPAAEKILSLKAEDVLGKKFAEIFIMLENVDEFNETIVDTILKSEKFSNKQVNITVNNIQKILNVTTSFLFDDSGKKIGVIVVFSDITEIEELKLTEKKLNEKLKEEHKKLQKSYLELEEKTESLKRMSKKLSIFRLFAMFFVFGLFSVLIYFVVDKSKLEKSFVVKNNKTAEKVEMYAVAQKRNIVNTIGFFGTISPLNTVNVVAPYSGQIEKLFINYGSYVTKGKMLCKIDPSEIMEKLREAEINYIKQKNHYEKLKNWKNSTEVAAAKRQLMMAKKDYIDAKNQLIISKSLYKKGIIPKAEVNTAIKNLESYKNTYESAKDNLQNVLNTASKDNLKIAKIQLDLIKTTLQNLIKEKEKGSITSPVNGVLLPVTGSDGKIINLDVGTHVNKGDSLFSIGNLTGFSIKINIDEADIAKIKIGMKVNVTLDAIPINKVLKGKISSLSLIPSNSSDKTGVPTYEAQIELKNIPPEIKKEILLGMSAKTEIIIYQNNSAVTVPIDCVGEDSRGFYVIKLKGKTTQKIRVEIGTSGDTWVEILDGVKVGDKLKRL